MNSTRLAKPRTSRKYHYVQVSLVLLFFVSIFINIGIMLHSHAREKRLVTELLSDSPNSSSSSLDFASLLAGNFSGSKRSIARSLAVCIKDKISEALPSFPLSYLQELVPLTLDRNIIDSLNFTLHKELQNQESAFRFLSQPIKHNHDYRYVHNPKDACQKRQIDVVIAVPSAPENFQYREKCRQGLKGSYAFVKNNNATVLFFIGRSNHHNKSVKFQIGINMEVKRFNDIVQEDYVDDFRNSSLKSVSVLKWVSTYCPHAHFLIKADDNIGIKPASVVDTLYMYRKQFGNFILGKWNTLRTVQRRKDAKYYVSFEEYPLPTFPPHVRSRAMGLPVTTAKLLFQASMRVKHFWIDDVFISGICAPLVNVPVMGDLAFDYKTDSW